MPHAFSITNHISQEIPQLSYPSFIFEYTDPEEGFKGWLVRDSNFHRLCAGGMRVQKGLQLDDLIRMAHNMSLKMRIHNLPVDGAKCGIDYAPEAPHKKMAIQRFIKALTPYLQTSYSMGPDLNTDMDELETLAHELSLPSVKMAISVTQGWELSYFKKRSAILKHTVNNWPLGRLRAGFGVAAAAFAVLDFLEIPIKDATFAIQGFGSLAKATAFTILNHGGKIVAISDATKCITATTTKGLELDSLLASESRMLPETIAHQSIATGPTNALWDVPCTIVIPAAVEQAVDRDIAQRLLCRAIVPGANLAVTSDAEASLTARGILVLPDFIPGSGGSLSMEGLYGPHSHPLPEQVLAHIEKKMRLAVSKTLSLSASEKTSPTLAALKICKNYHPLTDAKPYNIS